MQAALMKASAQAVERRFAKGGTPAQINGYQLTQLGALPRGVNLHLLDGDLTAMHSLEEFARETKGKIVRSRDFDPTTGEIWIGGAKLREAIEKRRFTDLINSILRL